jgi:beta-glucosidase
LTVQNGLGKIMSCARVNAKCQNNLIFGVFKMKPKLLGICIGFYAVLVFAGCDSQQKAIFTEVSTKDHSAVRPVPRDANWWVSRHENVLKQIDRGNVDIIFIGDSITHSWENQDLWAQRYAPRNAVNMGFSGDRTQHVLWRLDHGEIDGINPKLAVIMIGTNNSNGNDNTAEEIADGIIAICGRLRDKLPKTKILLLAIFPRNAGPSPQRQKNNRASELASAVADGKTIHYLDINSRFLEPDKTLSKEIMPDLLHPNTKGYTIWAEAIETKLAELLGE